MVTGDKIPVEYFPIFRDLRKQPYIGMVAATTHPDGPKIFGEIVSYKPSKRWCKTTGEYRTVHYLTIKTKYGRVLTYSAIGALVLC